MPNTRSVFVLATAMAVCALVPVQVSAALVTWTFSGEVTNAESPNGIGVGAGDPITGTATFDDALVPAAGAFYLEVDSDPVFDLTFDLGAFGFSAADDQGFGLGYPLLVFDAGQLTGFEFLASFPSPHDTLAFDVVAASVLVTDDADGFREVAAGVITAFTPPTAPPPPPTHVPEPATTAALGIGAAWALTYARRRRGRGE